jgi:hypothetical protein
MRGLAKGEALTATNPILQLFTRQGEFLTDPVAATYKIEDIHNPDTAPVEKVATTSFDLTDVGVGGNKLGPGRFYIPLSTGISDSLTFGTHRVVCEYEMVASGRTYMQVILFEVLDPAAYPSGQMYTGYVTTRSLLENGFVNSACAVQKLHRHVHNFSVQLEQYTERFFEPRFMPMLINGAEKPALFVEEAIIAIEKVEIVARTITGEDVNEYDNTLYRVYNRHLDGLLNPDDRYDPLLSMVETRRVAGVTPLGGSFNWPYGRQNVRVYGVFGFTDPEPQPDQVLIGQTPVEFDQIIGVMLERYMTDPSMSSLATQQPGRVKSYKTRDQAIQFYGASGNVSYTGGITGDPLLDQKLQRFVKPVKLRYTERDAYHTH